MGYCGCNSCIENDGDCDSDNQCQNGLVCGSKNCPFSLGFNSNTDCCYDAVVWDEDFCSLDNPCGSDEGDCDSNDECKTKLFCGSNNCPHSLGVSSSIDCCEPQGILLLNCTTIFTYVIFSY